MKCSRLKSEVLKPQSSVLFHCRPKWRNLLSKTYVDIHSLLGHLPSMYRGNSSDWLHPPTFWTHMLHQGLQKSGPAEQSVMFVLLTYVQLWRQRFLGETEQLCPIYVVGPEIVHQSLEPFLHQPRWHIPLRPITDQQLASTRRGCPWEGESKPDRRSILESCCTLFQMFYPGNPLIID